MDEEMKKRIAEMQEVIRKGNEITEEYYKDFVDPANLRKREYFQTEKGQEVKRKGWRLRCERMKEAMRETSKEERKAIRQFYYNTPDGYEVDHIIPVSRGGKHILSNLRYCTHWENALKANKLIEEMLNEEFD
jgi:histone acetyltransferase (RNA polymerase elongator complex component)